MDTGIICIVGFIEVWLSGNDVLSNSPLCLDGGFSQLANLLPGLSVLLEQLLLLISQRGDSGYDFVLEQ